MVKRPGNVYPANIRLNRNTKKISVTRDQLKASAARSALYLGLKKEFTSLVCLDTQYIAGIMMLVRSLEVGMNLHVIEPSANPFDTLPEDVTIDFTALVPYQVQSLLTSKHKEKFSSTKVVLIGGAALSNSLRENLKSMHGSFYATYGMTETLSHIALQKLNGSDTQTTFICFLAFQSNRIIGVALLLRLPI
ncbi:MAG: AMP-binding protein [Flammeovirgaceae bacterium]|nr:AMP-binding protein [Flammeovirgaceae bacterium]